MDEIEIEVEDELKDEANAVTIIEMVMEALAEKWEIYIYPEKVNKTEVLIKEEIV